MPAPLAAAAVPVAQALALKVAEGAAVAAGTYVASKGAPIAAKHAKALKEDFDAERAAFRRPGSLRETARALSAAAGRIHKKQKKRSTDSQRELAQGAAEAALTGAVGAAVTRSNPESSRAEINKMLRSAPPDWKAQYAMARSALRGLGLGDPGATLTVDGALAALRLTAGGKYSQEEPGDSGVTPPADVQAEALHGLRLSHKNNYGAYKFIGIARAILLALGMPLSLEGQKRMRNYFSRHKKDKSSVRFYNDNNPSRGYMAWLNWGGDQGQSWVNSLPKRNPKPRGIAAPMKYAQNIDLSALANAVIAGLANAANAASAEHNLTVSTRGRNEHMELVFGSEGVIDLLIVHVPRIVASNLSATDAVRSLTQRSEESVVHDSSEASAVFLPIRISEEYATLLHRGKMHRHPEQNLNFGLLISNTNENTLRGITNFIYKVAVGSSTNEAIELLPDSVQFTSPLMVHLEAVANPRRGMPLSMAATGRYSLDTDRYIKMSKELARSGDVARYEVVQTAPGQFRICVRLPDGELYGTHSWFTSEANALRRIEQHMTPPPKAKRRTAAAQEDIELDFDDPNEVNVEMTYVSAARWDRGDSEIRKADAVRNYKKVPESLVESTKDHLRSRGNYVGVRGRDQRWHWTAP